jgi:hypothetical protein
MLGTLFVAARVLAFRVGFHISVMVMAVSGSIRCLLIHGTGGNAGRTYSDRNVVKTLLTAVRPRPPPLLHGT